METVPRLLLNTTENARRSLARVLRAYLAGTLDATKYRNLVYGLSAMLGYYRQEADMQIEARLEKIEEAIEGRQCETSRANSVF